MQFGMAGFGQSVPGQVQGQLGFAGQHAPQVSDPSPEVSSHPYFAQQLLEPLAACRYSDGHCTAGPHANNFSLLGLRKPDWKT